MSTAGRHPVNVTHLVVGLVFLGIAGSWALRSAGLIGHVDARWALPLILLSAGLVGLGATVAKGLVRRSSAGGNAEEARSSGDPEDADGDLPG